jgi:hypothetical protein
MRRQETLMIEQALLRTSCYVFSAAILLAVGCKDTQVPSSGAPAATQEPGGSAVVAGPPAEAPVEAPVEAPPVEAPPAATATAGENVQPPPDDSTDKFVECTTRTNICTREYRPVCGKLTDGARKTYSNKCVACSDTNVLGYTAAACKTDQPPT